MKFVITSTSIYCDRGKTLLYLRECIIPYLNLVDKEISSSIVDIRYVCGNQIGLRTLLELEKAEAFIIEQKNYVNTFLRKKN